MGLRALRQLILAVATFAGTVGFAAAASAKDCAAIKAQGECKNECAWDKKKKACAPGAKATKGGAKGAAAAPQKGEAGKAAAAAAKDKGKIKPPTAVVGGKPGKPGKPGGKGPEKAGEAATKPADANSADPNLPSVEGDVGPVGDEDF